jgi:ParB-like chromosome segregation protein Spo0J
MTVRHLDPNTLTPPHVVVRPWQVVELAAGMRALGWQGSPLVGYEDDGGVQLLTGTHRRAAAVRANMATIPVKVYSSRLVSRCWGWLNRWTLLIQGRLA